MTRASDRVWNAAYAALAFAAAVALYARVLGSSVDVPYWDEWDWGPLVLAAHRGTLTLGMLWAQHNEHRIFFPQILMLALERYGFWSQRRECLASIMVATANLWFVWILLRRSLPARVAYPLLALDAFLIFSPAQAENWLWGFQTAWFLVDFGMLAAAVLLARDRITPFTFAGIVALAVLDAYSSAFGLAMLPAIVVAFLVRSRDFGLAHYVAWIVAAGAIAGGFFYGWVGTPAQNGSAIGDALQKGLHTLVVIGATFGEAGGVTASAAFGAVAVVVSLALLLWALRDVDSPECVTNAAWAGVLTYGLGASTLIGIGRAGFGAEQALASRYLTCSVIVWIALAGLGASYVTTHASQFRGLPVRGLGLAAGLVSAVALAQTWWWGAHFFVILRGEYDDLSGLIVRYRTASDDELTGLYPDGSRARLETAALAAGGELPEATLARDPAPHARGVPAEGAIDTADVVASQNLVHVGGWIVDPLRLDARDRLIALVDGRPARARVRYGLERSDIVTDFGIVQLGSDGFEADLDPAGLSSGEHVVGMELRDGAGRTLAMTRTAVFTLANGKITDAHVPAVANAST